MPFIDGDFVHFIGVRENPFRSPLNLHYIYTTKLDELRGDIRAMRNYFRRWRISIREIKPTTPEQADPEMFYVTGETVTPDINRLEYTNIRIFLYTDSFNNHVFSTNSWLHFKFTFCQILAHEMIHFRQAHNNGDEMPLKYVSYIRSQVPAIQAEREYHADKYEIEAYGHCMYLETQWLKFPKKDFKYRMHRTGIYLMHLEVFGGDHTSNVIKEVKKSAIRWKKKYEALHHK